MGTDIYFPAKAKADPAAADDRTGRLAARLCGTNDVRMFLHLTLQPVLQADLLHYAALRFQPVDMFLRILKNFFQNLS